MTNKNTPIYQQALIESKRVVELAKKEAEKSILKKLSPEVERMLVEEISKVPMLLEQEEPDVGIGAASAAPAMPATPPMDTPLTPPDGAMATSTMSPVPAPGPVPGDVSALPPTPTTAPLPTGETNLGIPIPGPDGKITIDIESLFSAPPVAAGVDVAAPTSPDPTADAAAAALMDPAATAAPPMDAAAMPAPDAAGAPAAPEEEVAAPTPAAAPSPIAEAFKSSLKSLELEMKNKARTKIQNKVLENKLLALYEVANNAAEIGEISKTTLTISEGIMEIMFAELKKTEKQDNSYKSNNLKEESDMPKGNIQTLKEYARFLFESEEAKGHAGFGDGGKAGTDVNNKTTAKDETPMKKSGDAGGVEDPGKKDSLTLSENDEALENELMEMLNAAGGEEEPAADGMAMKKEAIEKKLQALKEQEVQLQKELQECGMMGDGAAAGAPVNVNLKITVDKEGGVSDVAVDGDGSGEELASADGDEDLDLEIVDDSPSAETEEGEDLGDPDDDEKETSIVAESKLAKENRALRTQLKEYQNLGAKSIYVSKIMAEHNLSNGAKQKIVKFIDSAQNLDEAKQRYAKVKGMLEAGAKKPANIAGSSSKPAFSGGAMVVEGALRGTTEPHFNLDRMRELAGIKKKSV